VRQRVRTLYDRVVLICFTHSAPTGNCSAVKWPRSKSASADSPLTACDRRRAVQLTVRWRRPEMMHASLPQPHTTCLYVTAASSWKRWLRVNDCCCCSCCCGWWWKRLIPLYVQMMRRVWTLSPCWTRRRRWPSPLRPTDRPCLLP
jgi:hypothetical protein